MNRQAAHIDILPPSEMRVSRGYADILKAYDIPYRISPPYLIVRETQKKIGWTLHISVVKAQLSALLMEVLPLLKDEEVCFKIVTDEDNARKILDGSFSYKQLGKLICIHPDNDDRAATLAGRLICITSKFKGPTIPTDIRLGNCVYAGYGEYQPIISEDVTFAADLRVRFRKEKGVSWPFHQIIKPKSPKNKKLLNKRFLPVTLLKSNVKGCVFKAVDFKRILYPEWCVIKEGKKNMCADDAGRDIQDRLAWQWLLHNRLSNDLPIPKTIDLFGDDKSSFLALEFIDGVCLNNRIAEILNDRPWYQLDQIEQLQILNYLLEILLIVKHLHELEYVHRDLTLENFVIGKNNHLYMIDLELMYSVKYGSPLPPYKWGTPGFMSPNQMACVTPSYSDDIYSLGAIMKLLFKDFKPLETLITACISEKPDTRPMLREIDLALTQYKLEISHENN